MSYYMGDFYRPRGDPGIGSFFGGLVRSAVSLIPGVGPTLARIGGRMPGGAVVVREAGGGITAAAGGAMRRIGGVVARHPVLTAAGGAGVIGTMVGAAGEKFLEGGACPRGHHISKSKHAKAFGQCVRNRRMNVCNPRALRRAIRRARGFTKLAMHTIHLVHPKKKGRFGGFKRRRKAV